MGEFDTVRRLIKGRSIARFGDGELKILEGKGYSREPPNSKLTDEMRSIVGAPCEQCVIGIPTMDPNGPKYINWQRHESRFIRYFRKRDGQRYGSAFITRPDSAADNLESQEYVDLISRLWSGRERVAVLSESTSKLLMCAQATAASAIHIECPHELAYSVIDEMERSIIHAAPSIALLSCGPTATCLAHRLASRGIQAIDLGSIGGLLARWLPCEGNQETLA
jgi:hypothetical protein